MTVYFLTAESSPETNPMHIKVGFSRDIKRRVMQLQTGNSYSLAIMGSINTYGEQEDRVIEKSLHKLHREKCVRGEWFELHPEDVINALKAYSSHSFITVGDSPFEIFSYDRKAIPEYASVWEWGDVEHSEFCPACGWAGGLAYNENYGGERCLRCGASENDCEEPEYCKSFRNFESSGGDQ